MTPRMTEKDLKKILPEGALHSSKKGKRNIKSVPSKLEETLMLHIRAMEIQIPKREYYFDKGRKWRADFAWPAKKLLVECEGGINQGTHAGRHIRPEGFQNDCEKYNAAALSGWCVLRFTMKEIKSGNAAAMIECYLLDN